MDLKSFAIVAHHYNSNNNTYFDFSYLESGYLYKFGIYTLPCYELCSVIYT